MKAAEDDSKLNAISRAQAVIEFQTDGTIITANENFCSTVGYGLGEIQGNHHSMFVESDFAKSDLHPMSYPVEQKLRQRLLKRLLLLWKKLQRRLMRQQS